MTISDKRLRTICLSLPKATERPYHGNPSWRIPKRAFAIFDDDYHDEGRPAVWAAIGHGAQDFLVESNPDRCSVPPYLGPSGWVALRLESAVDWEEVAGVVEDAYAAQDY